MQIFNTIPETTIIQKGIQESFPKFFWDIDTNKLDMKDHYKLIITQAINYGSAQTIRQVFQLYSREVIMQTLKNPIRGAWFPKTYKAFCNLFDVEPDKSAVNVMCIRKEKTLMQKWGQVLQFSVLQQKSFREGSISK